MQIKTLLSCLLILTLTAFSAQAQDDIEIDESDVLDLTEASFDKIISETKYVLAEFMAPWCGHCKSLKPHYAEAASALKENTPPVALAKIDATEEKALAERYEVKGFPTLLWFVDGKPTPYTGGRTADTIVRWISKRTGPPAKTISTAAEYKEAVSGQRLALLAYFDAFEGPDYEAFTSAAQQEDGVEFLQTSTKEVAAAAGIKASPPTFALSTAFVGFEPAVVQSKGHAAFTGDTLAEDLASFLLAEKLPPFIEFSQSTQQQIFGSGIDKQVVIIGPQAKLAAASSAMEAVKAAHSQLKGKFAVVTSPLESEGSAPVANFFGADASSKELQVFALKEGKRYRLKDELTSKSLLAFTAGVTQGSLTPEFRSEEVPDKATDGEVVVVVGKSFDSLVKTPEKDVFLEVYSPNCGHCKSLAPTWKKLARQLKKVSTLSIAKLDGTANEHAELSDIQGFPHLVLFPANEGEPVPYNGDRTLKDMRTFLKKHASIPFEFPRKGKKDSGEGVKEEL